MIFGALSDITRSRFGKRTPWIVAGGLITAAGYVLAFSSAQLVGIVAGWCIVQVGVNMMIAPAVAVLSDRHSGKRAWLRSPHSMVVRRSSDHPPERSRIEIH